MGFLDNTGLAYFYNKIKEKFVSSINGTLPENGNINITNVETADNLSSSDTIESQDTFLHRISGGTASITNGQAYLSSINGNIEYSGRVEESVSVNGTNGISGTVNLSTWRNQNPAPVTGDYEFNYTRATWGNTAISSQNSGQTFAGTWSYDGSSVTSFESYGMTVTGVVPRYIEIDVSSSNLIASVVPSTFALGISSLSEQESYIFEYQDTEGATGWYLFNTNVTNDLTPVYGITIISGTAINGDSITVTLIDGTPNSTLTVTYVAPIQGTIIVAKPTSFKSVGFNQFNKEDATHIIANATIYEGEIIESQGTYVCWVEAAAGAPWGYMAFSADENMETGYIIPGAIGWTNTQPQKGLLVTQTHVNENFEEGQNTTMFASVNFEQNGYVAVAVTNYTRLCIHPRWNDHEDDDIYEEYEEDIIQFPTQDTSDESLPITSYGMPRVGNVFDTLDFENGEYGQYIQRIGYLENTPQNLSYVIALDVDYDYDDNSIYYVLSSPVRRNIKVSTTWTRTYTVNDLGTEEILGSTVPVGVKTLYGENLRNKLKSDVVTLSPQFLTTSQKNQVLTNIGAVTPNDIEIINENHTIKTYNSVEDIGIEPGTATIENIWTAMPIGSIVMAWDEDFIINPAQIPTRFGQAEFVKINSIRGYIHWYAAGLTAASYFMQISMGAPTGTWYKIQCTKV